jgi:hypothetical protein
MTVDTVGDASSTISSYNGYRFAVKVTASANGQLQTVGLNLSTHSGNIRTALYADSSGLPGALLAESSSVAQVAGWNDVAVTGVTIVSGTAYWLAAQISTNEQVYRTIAASDRYLAQTYGAFVNPFGSASTENALMNMRMTYAATDFSLSLSSGILSVNEAGGTGQLTVTVTNISGNPSVTLSGSGYPAGVSEGYSVNPVTATGTSILTVTATGSVVGGNYTITITGTGTGGPHTVTFTLTIVQQFTVTAAPTVINYYSPPYTSTITVTVGSSASPVTLSLTGVPAGVTAALSVTTGTPTFTSVVTFTITNPSIGSWVITVTGTNGTVTH